MRRDVAAVILAGGEGTRIGGRKPLLELAGERLIDRALRQAASWSDLTAIVVREHGQADAAGAAIITDEQDVAGPFGGLIAALRFAARERRELVLTIPVDMPFLPADLLDRFLAEIGDCACALARSGGHLHPVCGLWRVSALDQVGRYLAGKQRSLRGFAAMIGYRAVDWSTVSFDPFLNINTVEDLTEAERLLATC